MPGGGPCLVGVKPCNPTTINTTRKVSAEHYALNNFVSSCAVHSKFVKYKIVKLGFSKLLAEFGISLILQAWKIVVK